MNLARILRSDKGVTLIELLVVVVILGIIAAIVVPMVSGNQDEAYTNTNQQNLAIVNDALQRYAIDTGGSVDGAVDDSGADDVVNFTVLVGEFLTSEPAVYISGESTTGSDWLIDADGVASLPVGAD